MNRAIVSIEANNGGVGSAHQIMTHIFGCCYSLATLGNSMRSAVLWHSTETHNVTYKIKLFLLYISMRLA